MGPRFPSGLLAGRDRRSDRTGRARRLAAAGLLAVAALGGLGCATASDPVYQWLVSLASGPPTPPPPDTAFGFDVSITAGDPGFLFGSSPLAVDVIVQDPIGGPSFVQVLDPVSGAFVLFEAALDTPGDVSGSFTVDPDDVATGTLTVLGQTRSIQVEISNVQTFTAAVTFDAGLSPLGSPNPGLFGPVAALNSNAASDGTSSDFEPQLASDGAGSWVAVWRSNDSLGGTINDDWDILVARSSDAGATWTVPAPLNSNAASDGTSSDFEPQLTTDGAGNWVAVWRSDDSLGGTINDDWDILVARSSNAGATWTAPAPLNSNAATDGSSSDFEPQVTTDGAGNWVAVWRSNDSLGGTINDDWDILVARSSNAGATWTAPAPLNSNAASDGTSSDFEPQLATDGAGNWVAVWRSNDSLGGTINDDWDILVARSSDAGATWTAPAPLNTNAATDGTSSDFEPQLASDGTGNWVAVWRSDDSLGGTINDDWDILVARSSDAGATWTAPAALNSNAASDGSRSDFSPQLATDGVGDWVALWQSSVWNGSAERDIVVALSSDAGASWTAPALLDGDALSDSGDDSLPQLATDGAGHWVAAWYSNDPLGGTIGTDEDILFAAGSFPAVPIPALGPLGTALLAGLLGALGAARLRRRRLP